MTPVDRRMCGETAEILLHMYENPSLCGLWLCDMGNPSYKNTDNLKECGKVQIGDRTPHEWGVANRTRGTSKVPIRFPLSWSPGSVYTSVRHFQFQY